MSYICLQNCNNITNNGILHCKLLVLAKCTRFQWLLNRGHPTVIFCKQFPLSIFRYTIYLVDINHDGLWETRGSLSYYTDLVCELLVLVIDLLHYMHMVVSMFSHSSQFFMQLYFLQILIRQIKFETFVFVRCCVAYALVCCRPTHDQWNVKRQTYYIAQRCLRWEWHSSNPILKKGPQFRSKIIKLSMKYLSHGMENINYFDLYQLCMNVIWAPWYYLGCLTVFHQTLRYG